MYYTDSPLLFHFSSQQPTLQWRFVLLLADLSFEVLNLHYTVQFVWINIWHIPFLAAHSKLTHQFTFVALIFFFFLVWLICGLVTFGQMFIESHIPDLIVGWPLTGKNTIWKYMVYVCMYINYNVIVKLAYLSLMFDRCIPNTGCSANGGGYLRWCKRSVQNQDKSWIGHNERP